jgi:hypothetical protein
MYDIISLCLNSWYTKTENTGVVWAINGIYEHDVKEGTKESFVDTETCFYRSSNVNASGQGKDTKKRMLSHKSE